MGVLTWGQLRLNLQQTVPGISLDLIDEFLNVRYARVLDHTRWLALENTAYVETAAAYLSTTDTVTVTQGSNAVAGSGTTWTSALNGQKFQIEADGPFYTFTYVSATSATLDRPYEGTGGSGFAYKLFTNIYALPSDFKEYVQVSSADDGFDLLDLSEMEFGESVGFRDEVGEPAAFAITPSPTALDGGTTWQIEFFPIPEFTKGYPILYRRSAAMFTGSNTGQTSLPFVNDGVLLAGCRADIWAFQGDATKTKFYEAKFEEELQAMVRADRRKRPHQVTKPARRFTRHRLERLLRNTYPRIPN